MLNVQLRRLVRFSFFSPNREGCPWAGKPRERKPYPGSVFLFWGQGGGGRAFHCKRGLGKRELETSARLQLNRARAPERRPDAFADAAAATVFIRLAGSLDFRSRPTFSQASFFLSSWSTGKRRHGSGKGRTKKASARPRRRHAKPTGSPRVGSNPARGVAAWRRAPWSAPPHGRGRQKGPRSRQHRWCTADTHGSPPRIIS
jgi:hypothetical protein